MTANFHYEFKFGEKIVCYKYKKTDYKTIVYESLSIDGKELAFIDKKTSEEAKININKIISNSIETVETIIIKPKNQIPNYPNK